MANITGSNQILGTWGKVWWDGEEIFEVESFEAKITAERDTVSFAGSLSQDSKIKGLKGEGKMKIKKVFSRGVVKLLDAWKSGEDVRSQLIGNLRDPDTVGNQGERVVISNVWFNELVLMNFELGKKLDEEYSFGFTPNDVDYPDIINVQ